MAVSIVQLVDCGGTYWVLGRADFVAKLGLMKVQQHDFPQIPLASLIKRYPEGRRRKKMRRFYENMLVEAERLAEPQTVWDEFDLAETAVLNPYHKPEITAVVLALCTFGMPLQDRIHELIVEDIVSAAVLDEVMLAAMVALTRELHSSIREKLQLRNLKAGPAYRPGVGRWPIDAQKLVFDRLSAEEIGVVLNESLTMTPVHSTSLIIPIKPLFRLDAVKN